MRKKGGNMIRNKNVIGILGGMGPQASVRLVEMLIEISTKDFGAKNGPVHYCVNFMEAIQ